MLFGAERGGFVVLCQPAGLELGEEGFETFDVECAAVLRGVAIVVISLRRDETFVGSGLAAAKDCGMLLSRLRRELSRAERQGYYGERFAYRRQTKMSAPPVDRSSARL